MTAAAIIILASVLAVLASLPLVFVGARQWKRKAPKRPFDSFLEPSINLDALEKGL